MKSRQSALELMKCCPGIKIQSRARRVPLRKPRSLRRHNLKAAPPLKVMKAKNTNNPRRLAATKALSARLIDPCFKLKADSASHLKDQKPLLRPPEKSDCPR